MLSLKMKFFPCWEDIAFIRLFITYLVRKKIQDTVTLERVAIAASELISNACKHSALDGIIFEMKEDTVHSTVVLNIKNIASKENINEFEKIINMIKEDNPKEAYKKMMRRSIESTIVNQLGLARIRYECSGKMTFKILKEIREYFSEIQYIPEKENELFILSINVVIQVNSNVPENTMILS